jgi:hypothetical protein
MTKPRTISTCISTFGHADRTVVPMIVRPLRPRQSFEGARLTTPDTVLSVLRLASEIEPSALRALEWYRSVHIAELGNLTPRQLVKAGRRNDVLSFLRAIIGHERG